MEPEPDILNISAFYTIAPWMWSQDRTRAEGIMVAAMYLFGPEAKGVFGDGVIRPKLYVVQRGPDGRRKPVLAKDWSLDVEQAIPWRTKRPRSSGWGYGLPLRWGDLDLSGREIMMVITFERRDGLTISSSQKYFQVPKESL